MDNQQKTTPRPVGAALREWRQSRGLSQTQVAEAASMTQTNISKVETAGGALDVDSLVAIEDTWGAPRGTILRLSGHVEDPRRLEDCIASDPGLTQAQREVLGTWLRAMRAERREHS